MKDTSEVKSSDTLEVGKNLMKGSKFAKETFFSIIIPVYNGEKTIGRCLRSVFDSIYKNFEVIVVDDGSTDETWKIVQGFPCRAIRLDRNCGVATARNKGAEKAEGKILLFLDADVLVKKDSLNFIVDSFKKNSHITAVQGIYGKESPAQNLATFYKHYYNYYKFSKVPTRFLSSTSAFCLAIKKDVFKKVGGFDSNFPPHSAAEDVDLGLRLKKLNHPILLNRKLEVTHLKSYTLKSLLKTEFIKVVSNVKLMLRSESFRDYPVSKNRKRDMLNIIFSIALSLLIFMSFLSIFFVQNWDSIGIFLSLVIVFISLNCQLLNLIGKEKGFLTALGCLPIVYLDMLTAQIALIFGLIDFKLLDKRY